MTSKILDARSDDVLVKEQTSWDSRSMRGDAAFRNFVIKYAKSQEIPTLGVKKRAHFYNMLWELLILGSAYLMEVKWSF